MGALWAGPLRGIADESAPCIFAQLKLKGSKTDSIDAGLLADYGHALLPPRWSAPSTGDLALRDMGRQINRLTADRTRVKNRLHALNAKQGTYTLLLEDEAEAIEALDRRSKLFSPEHLKNA